MSIHHSAFIILSFLLAACAAPPAAVPLAPGDVLPVEAQRIIDRATATAIVVATQNAVSTETRRQTQQSFDDGYTATAVYQSVRATDAAATIAALDQAATATAQIAAVVEAGQQQQAAAEELRQWGETMRFALTAIFFAVVTMAVVAGSVIAVAYREKMKNEREHRRALADVEIMRLKLAALAAAIRETRAGTILPMLDGPPLVLTAGDYRVARAPGDVDELLDGAEEAPPADPIVINSNGGSHAVPRVTAAEQEAYGRMLHFLHLAATAHAKMNRRGWDENTLPGWRDIGLNSASEWTEYANLFGRAIERKPGKGTFCGPDYPTLRDLRLAVRFGKIKAVLHKENAI